MVLRRNFSLMLACILMGGVALDVSAQAPSPARDCGAEFSGCKADARSRKDQCVSTSNGQLLSDMEQCSRDHDERVANGANVIASGVVFQDCIRQALDRNSERLMRCASEHGNELGRCVSEYVACLIENLIGSL